MNLSGLNLKGYGLWENSFPWASERPDTTHFPGLVVPSSSPSQQHRFKSLAGLHLPVLSLGTPLITFDSHIKHTKLLFLKSAD